jgi:hypothetical protein
MTQRLRRKAGHPSLPGGMSLLRSTLAGAAAVLLLVSSVRGAGPVEGWASTWSGPGAATHDCVWPWTDCQPRKVQSLKTGVTIIVTPTMYCECVVPGAPHPYRLIDLDPSQVAALGLPPNSMYQVTVELVDGHSGLPDTATRP